MDCKVHRYYRISISIVPFIYCENTRVYTLKFGLLPKILGLFFVMTNILTGFWGLLFKWGVGIKNTFDAIMINISGGIDITDIAEEENHDERISYVYNDLPESSYYKLELEDIEIALELHDAYVDKKPSMKYSDENADFVLKGMMEIEMNHLEYSDMWGIFDSLEEYDDEKS